MSAKHDNCGNVNIDAVTESIVANGGGVSERTNYDGSTHVTVYSRDDNRHLSYDKDSEGNITNVHTDRDNHAYTQYKGGY